MADWMAFNVADYVANTLHLTTRQHGGYILLICAAWNGKGFLPGTDDGLRAITKLTPKEWREDGPALMAFLTRRGDKLVHERVEYEWNDAQKLIAAKSNAGKEGARRRWQGRANAKPIAEPSQTHRQNDAPKPLPLPSVTTTPSVANSAPAGASHTARSELITEKWEPSETDKAEIIKQIPWLANADLYAKRMADFRDWCVASATRSFNPAATWRGFMRKTPEPRASFGGPKINGQAATQARTDEPWEWRVSNFRKDGFWQSTWGPPPGTPGCFAPKELLQ